MLLFWVGFLVLVVLLLALDLGVFHRKTHVIHTREALLWTVFWIFLALLFNVFIYFAYQHHWLHIGTSATGTLSGKTAALFFFTGYLVEKSLSLDNIFVIAMIFSYFQVPALYQHRVLFWGILGALIMRGFMILLGTALVQRFSWMIIVFGVFLIITAVKMLFKKDESVHPEKNVLLKLARRYMRVTGDFQGEKFFVKMNGAAAVTPLFLVLLLIESMDVVFAVDSIPAIFAITTDPYLIFTSNVFAILGLRSLYFVLASLIYKFKYLKLSLIFILAYIGLKMILSLCCHIPVTVSLVIICAALAVGVLASIKFGDNKK